MDYVLDYDPLNWEDRYFLPGQSVDVLGLRAEGKPRLARKIDGLANVEPRAEARMVAARQGQHELAGLLERLVYSYAVLGKVGRVDHRDHVVQEIVVFLQETG